MGVVYLGRDPVIGRLVALKTIRVDADRDKAAASLYRVKGLPHMVFLTEVGQEIGSLPGFIPPDRMLKALAAALTAAPK